MERTLARATTDKPLDRKDHDRAASQAARGVVFGTLAWIFRARDERAEPIMLAIAAVTLSTMHQSSLGSLYLLMPNMLAPQWWSPVMPVSFFLSSIAAGTALGILIDMWIAKGWRRPLEITRLASVGQITFWALLEANSPERSPQPTSRSYGSARYPCRRARKSDTVCRMVASARSFRSIAESACRTVA